MKELIRKYKEYRKERICDLKDTIARKENTIRSFEKYMDSQSLQIAELKAEIVSYSRRSLKV